MKWKTDGDIQLKTWKKVIKATGTLRCQTGKKSKMKRKTWGQSYQWEDEVKMTLTEINRCLSEKKIFLVEEKGLADWAKQLERKSNREVRRTTFWGITKMIKVEKIKNQDNFWEVRRTTFWGIIKMIKVMACLNKNLDTWIYFNLI